MIPLLLILLIFGSGEARAADALTTGPSMLSGVSAFEPMPTNRPVNADFKRGACWAIRSTYWADNKSVITITADSTGIIQCDPPAKDLNPVRGK